MIEHMFDSDVVSDLEEVALPAAVAVDTIGAAYRAESASIAARLTAIGSLDAIRVREWVFPSNPFEGIAAEVAAAMSLSASRGRSLLQEARTVRDRLPAVMAVFAVGDIDYRIIRMVIARTDTVAD